MRIYPLASWALAVFALMTSPSAHAAQPALVITHGKVEHQFNAAELLAMPDTAYVTVQTDVFDHPTTYRAVPLLSLLGHAAGDQFDTLETRALDGFVSQIPLALIERGAKGGAVAWIAVEDPQHPWPPLPNKTVSAGPFYLVWEHPERSGVSTEQWPFQLASIAFTESPVHRWPQLAVPADLPDASPARHGQEVFLVQCLPCHRLNGGGTGEVGPDLARPMSPTQYLTDAGLRAIIRNTRAVRTWPGQQMDAFDKTALPDADLDAVVAYLHAMASSVASPAKR
ncbi:MAG TPA: cytochrome c [Aliidongia sp.]|nr:cytochrome c [Aliidongia sp.]